LSLPERRLTSVTANSGTPYVPFLAKVMPKNFVNFGITLLKIGHMICEMSAGTHETLEFAGTSINFRSGKFGYSICPFFSKGYAKKFREFWHDFAKNRTYSCVA